MPYRVFLVEDEVITREGIRDNVAWHACGFAFCGEASDGELALPLIQSLQPDLLITDIKMPFMDGLQLSRLVREKLPGVRIVILSGHDEFQYAREAISIGVSDYLLKPLGVREMEELLRRISADLDQERADRLSRRQLQEQVELDQGLHRDRFLLRLLTVGASPAVALEESSALNLDLMASAYQVLLVRYAQHVATLPEDFAHLEAAHHAIHELVSTPGADRDGWHVLRKDVDETVIVARGRSVGELQPSVAHLVETLHALPLPCGSMRVRVGIGSVQQRIHELNLSFSAAQVDLHTALRSEIADELRNGAYAQQIALDGEEQAPGPADDPADDPVDGPAADLVRINRQALADYLHTGLEADFDAMFARYVGGLDPATIRLPLVHSYLRIDMAITIARFVNQIGGAADHLFAGLGAAHTEGVDLDRLRADLREACQWTLELRNQRAQNRNLSLVERAQRMIEASMADPKLSLGHVAREVGLSPNHFSAVFSSETGETFRDYLTRLRITRAKMLLRSSACTNSEVSIAVGYSDPHYFGAVFKRVTGLSPQQYRSQTDKSTSLREGATP